MSPLRGLGLFLNCFPGADAPRLQDSAAARLRPSADNAAKALYGVRSTTARKCTVVKSAREAGAFHAPLHDCLCVGGDVRGSINARCADCQAVVRAGEASLCRVCAAHQVGTTLGVNLARDPGAFHAPYKAAANAGYRLQDSNDGSVTTSPLEWAASSLASGMVTSTKRPPL